MEQSTEEITAMLGSISMLLTTLDTKQLEAHVRSCKQSLSRAGSLGAILDPTGYRNALQFGQLEDALEIVEALLVARKAIDIREAALPGIERET